MTTTKLEPFDQFPAGGTPLVRNPTMVAECGCPYDPEYDEGHLGWHLIANHPENWFRLRTPFGTIRQPTIEECELVGRDTAYAKPIGWRDYRELGDYVIDLACDRRPVPPEKKARKRAYTSAGTLRTFRPRVCVTGARSKVPANGGVWARRGPAAIRVFAYEVRS